jgi:hypothetical protein
MSAYLLFFPVLEPLHKKKSIKSNIHNLAAMTVITRHVHESNHHEHAPCTPQTHAPTQACIASQQSP